MRTNTVKRKLLRGEPSIGAEAGLGSVLSAEALSRVGFDYVVVDMQHGAWTEDIGDACVPGDCVGVGAADGASAE